MRLKDYPEIIVDEIPKLYESHIKVFITHLHGMQEQVHRLPKKFCKIYTTRALADQIFEYLFLRNANISKQDFQILEDTQPFVLRLSDGKRLQVMLCAGNELGNSLMFLIRKVYGGRMLYYYSAVQQDDLCYLMGNATYQEWIRQGTEVLFLNLQAASKPYEHIDFDLIAAEMLRHSQDIDSAIVIKLPLFGFEFVAKRLAQTEALCGTIKLVGNFLRNYRCLTSDLRNFHQPGYKMAVNMMDTYETEVYTSVMSFEKPYPIPKLKWSPVPTRMNLVQLCSLLRPLHISGIICPHDKGNAPSVPDYLKHFKLNYSPRTKELEMPQTADVQDVSAESQLKNTEPFKSQQAAKTQCDPFVYSKPRKIAFVDYDDDDTV